jgi:hypothetical protein
MDTLSTDSPLSTANLDQRLVTVATLGTLAVHALVVGLMIAFSGTPEEPEERPQRTIITTQLAKLGGGGKIAPDALPTKKTPSAKAPDAMPNPTAPKDPTIKPTPTNSDEETPRKPTLDDLLKKNASNRPSDTEGEGEGDGPPGPGVANGSPNGTSLDPNARAGYLAELGSLFHRYYKRSSTISDSECRSLSVVVKLKVADDLRVLDFEIVTPSGNDVFDSSVGPAFAQMIDEKIRLPEPPSDAGITTGYLTSGRAKIQFNCAE